MNKLSWFIIPPISWLRSRLVGRKSRMVASMNKIKAYIWFIKNYGPLRLLYYEICRKEGLEINYSKIFRIFTIDEIKMLEDRGLTFWETQSQREQRIFKRTKEQPPMDKGEHDKDFLDA